MEADLKEQNRAYKASEDVGDAEVTIKEEKPEHLDMWAFKDVVVREVKTMKLEELQEDVVPAEAQHVVSLDHCYARPAPTPTLSVDSGRDAKEEGEGKRGGNFNHDYTVPRTPPAARAPLVQQLLGKLVQQQVKRKSNPTQPQRPALPVKSKVRSAEINIKRVRSEEELDISSIFGEVNDKRGRWEDVGQLKKEAEEACEQESPCMVVAEGLKEQVPMDDGYPPVEPADLLKQQDDVQSQSMQKTTNHEDNKENEIVCKDCGKVYATVAELKKHVYGMHKKKHYKCDWPNCAKTFHSQSKLEVHQRTHTGEKPFLCTESDCEKAFRHKVSLQRHKMTHTGEKPFLCTEPGCEKTFRHKSYHFKGTR